MAFEVSRIDVWMGSLRDTPGALAKKLAKIADAGANLEFVLGRRRDHKKGSAVVFVAPLRAAVARKAGLRKSPKLVALRVVCPDKLGCGAAMTAALAEAGINLRGLSASVVGKRCVVWLALESAADAALAARVLRKL
jgi:hypothetical protein